MADEQVRLNGGYYGVTVAIPPPQKYHSPGRSGRSGRSGCCCLLSCLCQLIISLVVIIGLAALIFWIMFQPINIVKFHADDVSLKEFNLTGNKLHYDLSLNLSIRNPNKKIGIYYDSLDASTYYQNHWFGSVCWTPFYQGYKDTSVLEVVLQGQEVVSLCPKETAEYYRDKTAGNYSIDLELYLKVRFRLFKIKTFKFKPTIVCDLKVPLDGGANGGLAGAADSTECKLKLKL